MQLIDNENIKALADRFHSKGFSLMVDDFGAGYSSLATLNMKCFDTLKIDKSLIDYIGDFSGEKLLEQHNCPGKGSWTQCHSRGR